MIDDTATPGAARPFRIVVSGSRRWTDREMIERKLRYTVLTALAGTADHVVIIQGGADGADAIARAWAQRMRLRVETFAAEWQKHGKAAGPIRNESMAAAQADILLAFPLGDEGTSPGTWDCIRRFARRGIPVSLCAKATLEGTVPG